MPGGSWLVAAVGLFLTVVAVHQVSRATDDALGSELGELGLVEQRRIACWASRAGFAGFGVFRLVEARYSRDAT